MPRYEVTDYDVCISGYERLRSQDEFLLLATPTPGQGWNAIRKELESDLQVCDRGDDFDYGAARRAVRQWCAAARRAARGARNPFRVDGAQQRSDDAVTLFVYVRDTAARGDV